VPRTRKEGRNREQTREQLEENVLRAGLQRYAKKEEMATSVIKKEERLTRKVGKSLQDFGAKKELKLNVKDGK
jgi:hypothetical protein